MKIREEWLVEGVSIYDGGLLVEFDSRQSNASVASGQTRGPSKITKVEDGDDQIQMSTDDGRAFAARIGERVTVTLEIDDGAPQAEPYHRRCAREALGLIQLAYEASTLDRPTFDKIVRLLSC